MDENVIINFTEMEEIVLKSYREYIISSTFKNKMNIEESFMIEMTKWLNAPEKQNSLTGLENRVSIDIDRAEFDYWLDALDYVVTPEKATKIKWVLDNTDCAEIFQNPKDEFQKHFVELLKEARNKFYAASIAHKIVRLKKS